MHQIDCLEFFKAEGLSLVHSLFTNCYLFLKQVLKKSAGAVQNPHRPVIAASWWAILRVTHCSV